METVHLAAAPEERDCGRARHPMGEGGGRLPIDVDAESPAEVGIPLEQLLELRKQLPAGFAARLPEIDEEETRLLLDQSTQGLAVDRLR